MSIVINGITLDHDSTWEDEFKFSYKEVVADRTLEGEIVTQSYDKIAGRPITLKGDNNHGWLKRSTVLALTALDSSSVFDFDVTIYGVTYRCRLRKEDSPALEFDPITNVNMPDSNFWYYGTIKLITV
jgi:hypothetical protein